MAALKTKKTELSVDDFIKKIPELQKQKDAFIILGLYGIKLLKRP